jgi:hypothetical protein
VYNKLFTSILDSSIWLESTPTRIVWVTFLAAMDETGFARFATIGNVALRARVSEEEARNAIEALESPDRLCPEQDMEGRRIERVDGGWFVLNSKKYRDISNREKEKEQTRLRVARHRAKKSGNAPVTPTNEKVTRSEAEAEAEASKRSRKSVPPGREEVDLLAAKAGLPNDQASAFWDFYESKGWMVGKNKMVSVAGAMAGWARRWRAEQQKPQSDVSPTTLAILHQKELDEVTKKMQSLRATYSGHQDWSEDDKTRWFKLKARRDELKKLLGMQV